MKVYNKESMLVLPITTKAKDDKFHFKISSHNASGDARVVYIKLTQIRVVSPKRLLRKVDTLEESAFKNLKERLLEFLV